VGKPEETVIILDYVTRGAAALAPDPKHTDGCEFKDRLDVQCDCGFYPSVLEQRIAIGILQARALECRHWADVLLTQHRDHPIAVKLARHLAVRSQKLEKLGLDLCKVWPPYDPAKPEEEQKVDLQ
jgi:hypothetical protein